MSPNVAFLLRRYARVRLAQESLEVEGHHPMWMDGNYCFYIRLLRSMGFDPYTQDELIEMRWPRPYGVVWKRTKKAPADGGVSTGAKVIS